MISQHHLSLPDRCARGGLCRVSEGLHRLARTGRAAGQRGRPPAAALPQTLLACRGALIEEQTVHHILFPLTLNVNSFDALHGYLQRVGSIAFHNVEPESMNPSTYNLDKVCKSRLLLLAQERWGFAFNTALLPTFRLITIEAVGFWLLGCVQGHQFCADVCTSPVRGYSAQYIEQQTADACIAT